MVSGRSGAREEHFARVHQRQREPRAVRQKRISWAPVCSEARAAQKTVVEILVPGGLAPSKTEARRLVKAGAVTMDGNKVTK